MGQASVGTASSCEPSPSADEVDAQRKEAIKAKVGDLPRRKWVDMRDQRSQASDKWHSLKIGLGEVGAGGRLTCVMPDMVSVRQSLRTRGQPGGVHRMGGGDSPQPLILLQVGQYVSRAEELKAIVSSSNQALLRQGTTVQELLRGRLRSPVCAQVLATPLRHDRETDRAFLCKNNRLLPHYEPLLSHQRWPVTSHASSLPWKWPQLPWPRFVLIGRGPGGQEGDQGTVWSDVLPPGCRRRKLAESRMPWTYTSTASGSCCCCWQVRPRTAAAHPRL